MNAGVQGTCERAFFNEIQLFQKVEIKSGDDRCSTIDIKSLLAIIAFFHFGFTRLGAEPFAGLGPEFFGLQGCG